MRHFAQQKCSKAKQKMLSETEVRAVTVCKAVKSKAFSSLLIGVDELQRETARVCRGVCSRLKNFFSSLKETTKI